MNCILGLFSPRIAASEGVGPLVLLIFAFCLFLAFFYVLWFVPETKGLSLEQVDEYYNSGVPVRSLDLLRLSFAEACADMSLQAFKSADWQPTKGAERRGAFQMTVYKIGEDREEASTHPVYPTEKKEGEQVQHIEHHIG